jgi:hypothetical protein
MYVFSSLPNMTVSAVSDDPSKRHQSPFPAAPPTTESSPSPAAPADAVATALQPSQTGESDARPALVLGKRRRVERDGMSAYTILSA